jgi:hypothetical protein
VTRGWDRHSENLYSVWIEKLFDAPLDKQPVWKVLHEALRDRERNLLYNHLGFDEDGKEAPVIDPDCADLPYTLRSYFAFKLGLPMGYSRCSRGTATAAPYCARWVSASGAGGGGTPVKRLEKFLRVTVANAIHSGTVRVKGDDDKGDFYPVRLSPATLRPGTVYADPYGHIMVLVKRLPQTKERGGVLLAVDGQPDGTVSRRRFWRGNFLFDADPVYGGPGFKRFRPLALDGKAARPLTNAEISAHADYGDYALEQFELGLDGFYDRVDEVLSPEPMDARQAYLEIIQALDEQVRGRIVSVNNGVEHKKKSPGLIEMPDGAEIFETQGAWEDFSTPSRDMRLLIAIDTVRAFPERAAKRAKRFATKHDPKALVKELEALLDSEAKKRRFSYQKSDGTSHELSIADVLARGAALEMAYNPNDCPEVRWGAPDKSPELASCRWRAPGGQRQQMEGYRSWFATRRRPPRP